MRTVLLIACCLMPVALSGAEIPDRTLRESAERILAEDAFQGFDRAPKGGALPQAPTAPADSTGDANSKSGEPANSSDSRPANWWDRFRPQTKSKGSSGSSTEPSAGKPEATSSASSPQTPPAPATEASRPQRDAAARTPPSQRGQDGITRPVRFAPKVRAPRPPPSSWNLNLDWLSGFGVVLGSLLHGLAYAALVAVCVLIIVLVVRAFSEVGWSHTGPTAAALSPAAPLAHDRSPGETEADQFLHEAVRLADLGDYRPALGQLVLGAMSSIERRQWIRYRRGLTLNDYVRSVRSRPEQLSGLRTVIDTFEPVEYGRRHATESAFATALSGYRQAFAATEN